MHIKAKDGKNYLVDGGGKIDYDLGKKTLKPYLLKNGVRRLDGAFVTHLHTDHYKGVAELCREGMVKKLFLYEGNRDKTGQICQETGMSAEDLVFLRAGQTVSLDDAGFAKSVMNDAGFAYVRASGGLMAGSRREMPGRFCRRGGRDSVRITGRVPEKRRGWIQKKRMKTRSV